MPSTNDAIPTNFWFFCILFSLGVGPSCTSLASLGGLLGLGLGLGICALLRAAVPGLPIHTPLEFALAAIAVSLVTGIVSGVAPARRAASLDPVEALRAE